MDSYNTRSWRELPRDSCAVAELLGVEDCLGAIHLHHVHPLALGGDFGARTVPACARHHPMLEALARRAFRWQRCPHPHRTREAREACERRLNRAA